MSDETEQKPRLIKVLMLGDDYVGKSTISDAIMRHGIPDQEGHEVCIPIFMEGRKMFVEKPVYFEEQLLNVQIWDTDCVEHEQVIPPKYFENVDVAIMCIDMTNKESFENIGKWIELLDERTPIEVPIGFVGNKCDEAKKFQVTKEEVTSIGEELEGFVHFISAYKNQGIEELLALICETALNEDSASTEEDEQKKSRTDVWKNNVKNEKVLFEEEKDDKCNIF